jgi:Uma2 family endonuclease
MSQPLPHLPSKDGEPAWEAAYFFPPQGRWSEETFLQFHTNQMAELVNGHLELLPMPNVKHQRILLLLIDWIRSASPNGLSLFAPLPTKLFPGTIREPDLLYISPENIPAPEVEYPSKVDLAVEIVSDGAEARKRDYEDKRIDYAKAGIREYWIVDPQDQVVTVLVLEGEQYIEHGKFTCGQTATGKLLPAFAVDVQSIMSV